MLHGFMDDLCWLNGTFLPLREARVSVEDRGFNFADGVYEVFRLYPSGFFRLGSHLARLRRSCAGIELAFPLADEDLTRVVDELAKRRGLASAMVYLQVTRGPAPRHHSFPVSANPTVMMSIKPLPAAT
ncbi:MAG: aminotransferase class IV, partial [Burkholderiales bacterium]|nr:aminotransferase class IV [Phycisphaerae bacterium]